MLKRIHITNFQSHKTSVLDLVPGINVIIGSSDTGKSAILRSLLWVWKNRPLGDGFIRDGETEVEVTTDWENKKQDFNLTRRRTNSTNSYILTGYEPFSEFGVNPPSAVEEVLNLSEINFQTQFKPYFLVFETPGFVANYLRSVTGLNEIDKIVKCIESKQDGNSRQMKLLERDLITVNEGLDKLNKIPVLEIERNIEKVKRIQEESEKLQAADQRLNSFYNQLFELESQIVNFPTDLIPVLFKQIEEVSSDYLINYETERLLDTFIQTWEEIESNKINISLDIRDFGIDLAEEYIKTQDRLKTIEGYIENWENLENSKIELPDTNLGQDLIQDYNSNLQLMEKLNEYINSIDSLEKELTNLKLEKQALRIEEQELISQLSNCPHCGSELTEATAANLIGGIK